MQQTGVQVGETLLGKYRIERVLGQGGMGVVLATRHTQLNELFALKMMLPEALAHPGAAERFVREAQACARLKGEHIARVHDVGTLENGAPYMVMEYLSGEDLGQILQNRGALSVEETAFYVYQACEAIAEAHANGIIHRDLKPSNLFLTQRPNGTPCVKVLDFGISREINAADRVGPNLTKTGTAMGSPVYMPPEQMANAKSSDARSDIWSLGVILYELVTGNLPFCAELMTEIVTKVLVENPVPPSQVRPGIAPTFDTVIMRCLDKQPKNRYQSVAELMRALRPFVPRPSHEPVWAQETIPAHLARTSSEWTNTASTGNVPVRNGKKPRIVALGVLGIVALFGTAAAWTSRANADKPTLGANPESVKTAAPPPIEEKQPAPKDPAPPATQETTSVEPLAPISPTTTAANAQPTLPTKRITSALVQKPNPTATAPATATTPKKGVILVPR
mgnify:CR=1 FL=1